MHAQEAGRNTAHESTAAATSAVTPFYARPGPWGKLRCSNIFIEPPRALIERIVLPDKNTVWSFPASEWPRLPELFEKAGLPAGFRASLLDPANMEEENGMVRLHPPLLDLMEMTPTMRAAVYHELARHPANVWHSDPKVMTAPSVDEWFRGSTLGDKLLSLVRQTAYPMGDSQAFSDIPALLNYVESEAEARALLKAHGRTHSLLVKLELDDTVDLEKVIDYWSAGSSSRRNDIEPMLRSINELTPGQRRIDIVHLLPPLPRMLLYTYPGAEFYREGAMPDCHWTSLNFFRFDSQPHLADERLAATCFRDQYVMVQPPYQFGDVIAFMDSDFKVTFHSCVYLADDLVLTKNGRHILRPWVISKLSDVERSYFLNATPRLQGLRDKRLRR